MPEARTSSTWRWAFTCIANRSHKISYLIILQFVKSLVGGGLAPEMEGFESSMLFVGKAMAKLHPNTFVLRVLSGTSWGCYRTLIGLLSTQQGNTVYRSHVSKMLYSTKVHNSRVWVFKLVVPLISTCIFSGSEYSAIPILDR